MKTKLILLLIIFSFKCYSQTISKQIRNDFCKNALFQYKYGNDTFKAVMNMAVRNIGANTLEELVGSAENICYNTKLQNEFFKIVYSFGGNRDMIFMQFHSIGMKAENASKLTDYLEEKFNQTNKKDITKEKVIVEKETEISKSYNIKEKDINLYNELVEEQKNKIFEYLKNTNENQLKFKLEIPIYQKMISDKMSIYNFDNTYKVSYKKNDYSRPTVTTEKVVYAGSNNIQQINNFENLEGSDKESKLININQISIPTFTENGKEIMTELTIDSIRTIYKKGYVFAKIKKKQFILEDSSILEKNIENEIKSKMQQQKKGNYLIGYIYINVMGKEDLIVNFEELKKDNSVLNKFLLKSSYSIMRSLL
ncbi:hypothetical protein [Chishuiella sp.]|uniref:hypothetical protein n=1 Tax=Chishuiella sp. TaxID=1969467 RepID=UPI0028A7BC43|nr:hypothetical protein [Chishuiella sp.]